MGDSKRSERFVPSEAGLVKTHRLLLKASAVIRISGVYTELRKSQIDCDSKNKQKNNTFN